MDTPIADATEDIKPDGLPSPGDKAEPIDPLRRVFVPKETKTPNGTIVLRTTDSMIYVRLEDGSIRRAIPKVRGKAARRADKLARRVKE